MASRTEAESTTDSRLDELSVDQLKLRIQRLEKVNRVLMAKVEEDLDSFGGNFDLFETNARLAQKVAERTEDMERMQQILLERQSRLQAILDSTIDAILTFDKKGQVTSYNQIAVELFELTPLQRQDLNIERLNMDVDSVVEQSRLGQVVEMKLLKTNGQEFSAAVTVTQFAEHPNPGYTLIVRDLTEAIAARDKIAEQEAALAQAAKLAALGEMSGGIAHEINNPLTILMGRIGQIEHHLKRNDCSQEQLLEFTAGLNSTCQRIARVVRGLRTFAREGSRDPYSNCSLREIVESTLDLCRERFRIHGVRLEEPIVDEQIELECQSVQISQVLLNLVNNAFDAVVEQPDSWVRIDVLAKQQSVEIAVIDSGSGVPEHVAQKMMQPFFTTKSVGQGTGLGLSISRGIVMSHGGTLEYDLKSPNTRFVVVIPFTQSEVREVA